MAQREGYFVVDHRASPGMTEAQALACGYDPAQCREGKVYETKLLTCRHCKTAAKKNPFRLRPRESCTKCGGKYVCDFCYARMQEPDYDHTPFEKLVDLAMDSAAKGIPFNARTLLLPSTLLKGPL